MKLKGKRILVTGGSGFLGRIIVEKLEKKGANVFVPRSKHYNLVDYKAVMRCFRNVMPNMVIHSAAFYGGIWLNKMQPARVYFKNLVMGANVVEMCRYWDVEKIVVVGTGCAYPDGIERLMVEEDFWDGLCHESVRSYGMAKKILQIQCEAYKKQYGLNSLHLILTNLYGEWDSYNPDRSHVAAALIRKFVEAKINNHDKVEVWGTGKPIREFLYVGDAAEGIVRATEEYDDPAPLNIGTGIGTTIKELVDLIVRTTGFKGELVWNAEKPDGQYMKTFSIEKLKKALNWQPETSLEAGLGKTIKWFEANYEEAIKRW